MDHGDKHGWNRYGFDNLAFTRRRIHGSDDEIGVRLAFNRGVGGAHVSFGVIPPHTGAPGIGMHIHRDVPTDTDVEEWYIIIDGEGVMTFSNGDTVHAGPGDMLVVHPGTGHSFQTVGDVPVRLISITPTMYTSDSPVDEPVEFKPRIQVTDVDASMNPNEARCADCDAVWERPPDDRGSNTLPVWAREHECTPAMEGSAR
jgi:mannose-6-phosphate isomerase-like protein (cupin superfamily)